MSKYIENLEESMQSILKEGIADDLAKLLGIEKDEAAEIASSLSFSQYLELANAVDVEDREAAMDILDYAGPVEEATIAQYDAWANDDIDADAEALINKAIDRCGDDLSAENVIRKIKTGWSGLNPATVNRAIEFIKNDSIVEDNKLLDKPTPTLGELAKKHNVPLGELGAQLATGIKIELEHTNDRAIAKEIALDHLNELPDYYDRLKSVEEADNPFTPITPPSEQMPSSTVAQGGEEESDIGRMDVDDLRTGDDIEVIDIDGEPVAVTVKNPRGPGDTLVVQTDKGEEHMVKKQAVSGTPKMEELQHAFEAALGEKGRWTRIKNSDKKLGQKINRAERIEKKKKMDHVDEAESRIDHRQIINMISPNADADMDARELLMLIDYAFDDLEMEFDAALANKVLMDMGREPIAEAADKIKPFNKMGYAPKAGSWKKRMHKAQPPENHEKTKKRHKKLREEDPEGAEERKAFKGKLKDPTQYYIRREYHIGKTPYRDFKAEILDGPGPNGGYKVRFTDDKGEEIVTWYPAPGEGALSGRFYDERLLKAGEKGRYVGGDSRANWPPVGEDMNESDIEYLKMPDDYKPAPKREPHILDKYDWTMYLQDDVLSMMDSFIHKMKSQNVWDKGVELAGGEEELLRSIQYEAEDVVESYRGTGEGIGTSDINHFVRSIFRDLGEDDIWGWDKPKESIEEGGNISSDKIGDFIDLAYNRKGNILDRLLLKNRALSREAAEKKLINGGFTIREIQELESWLKKAIENVSGRENIIMLSAPNNFGGWGHIFGTDKETGMVGIGGDLDASKAFNMQVMDEFKRLARGSSIASDEDMERDKANRGARFRKIGEAASKLGCTKCDEVSTEAAWEKNDGSCPKCNNSTQGVAEARNADKTEHSGAKKGKGGYYGRKKDAKSDSNKARRENDKKAVDESEMLDRRLLGRTAGYETEQVKVKTGQRPKGIGWELKQAGEQTGKEYSVWQRKFKAGRIIKKGDLVTDRKTGKQYDPHKEMDNLLQDPETKAMLKRLAKEDVTEEITHLRKLAGIADRVDEVKAGTFNSPMIGQRVKIVSQEDSFGNNHYGEEGVITRASREHTFSQMVPFIIEYGVQLDSGEKITIRRESIRKIKQVSETASGGATGAGAIASAPTAMGGMQSRNPSIYGQATKPKRKKRKTKEEKSDGIGRTRKE